MSNSHTKMLGRIAAEGVNGYTKSQCNCGRRGCSDIRAWQRKSARRVLAQADRQEFRDYR